MRRHLRLQRYGESPVNENCHVPALDRTGVRGRENLVTFMQRFRTWACVSRCDSALDSEIVVKTSGTPLAELERLHDRTLVDNSLQAWLALTKALEKEEDMLKMVIDMVPLGSMARTREDS